MLRHPHLQPYVEKIHLQTSNPRCGNLPDNWDETDSNCIDKATLPEAEDERTTDPTIYEAEVDSFYTDDKIKPVFANLEQRLAKLKAEFPVGRNATIKAVPSKASDVMKNPRLTRAKTFGTPKRQPELSRNKESVRFILHPIRSADYSMAYTLHTDILPIFPALDEYV